MKYIIKPGMHVAIPDEKMDNYYLSYCDNYFGWRQGSDLEVVYISLDGTTLCEFDRADDLPTILTGWDDDGNPLPPVKVGRGRAWFSTDDLVHVESNNA